MDDFLRERAALCGAISGPYAIRALADDHTYYALHTRSAVVDPVAIDRARMSVPCVITTQDEDRYRDIVVTAGIDLAHHTTNPVVLMEHGRGVVGGKATTIARACDPDGQYTVVRAKKQLRAVSWFSNRVRESEDAYALVEEGLLNGVSIGFGVKSGGVKYREDHADDYEGWPGLLFGATELREYSHCAIGVNPHCLVDRLQKSISGRAWSPHTLQTLAPLLPPLREQVTGGWTPVEEGRAVTTPNTTPAAAPANGIPPEWATAVEKVVADAVAKAVAAAVPVAAPVATPTPVATAPVAPEVADDETRDWPPGAKCLTGLYDLRMLENEYLELGMRSQENEDVRLALADVADANESLFGTLGEVWARSYGTLDVPSPFDLAPADGEEETEAQRSHNEAVRVRLQKRLAHLKAVRDARARQSWALTQSAKAALASASATLAELSTVAGLSEAQRAACVALSATVKGLATSPGTTEDAGELRAENERLKADMLVLAKQHQQLQREFSKARLGR